MVATTVAQGFWVCRPSTITESTFPVYKGFRPHEGAWPFFRISDVRHADIQDHAAFEVEDVDALMAGHDHLKNAGFDHHAGIGRHILGSQTFDYWRDPWGHVVEHFTDGDLLNADYEAGSHDHRLGD